MRILTTVHDLKSLILSYHSLLAIETVEEERVSSVLRSAAADLRLPLLEWSFTRGLVHLGGAMSFEATEDPRTMLKSVGEMSIEAIFHLKDFTSHLQNAAVHRSTRDLVDQFHGTRSTFVLTGEPLELPPDLEKLAVRLGLHLPSDNELKTLVRSVIESLQKHSSVRVNLNRDEVGMLLRALRGLTLGQARQVVAQAIVDDGQLDGADISHILRRKGELIDQGGLLEYFPVEDNRFELGGFDRLKAWLDKAKVGFSPAARELNLPAPRGVLFVGVQGCGKSLAAKYIARKWQLPLLKLDGGRLYDKYIGESERNMRKAMSMAEAMAPLVLWIDEIEKVFIPAGSSESDAGLSRRMFGSFLTWLQEKKKEVFVVGAANDLTIVPPELLRKGRFDEIFFVDLPDASEREQIFKIHLTRRKQKLEGMDLKRLAEATEGFSGAEIEQVVVSALYRTLQHKTRLITEGLLEEISQTVPLSVSRSEDIAALRESARGRFVPVA
jgi:hypothetical protein